MDANCSLRIQFLGPLPLWLICTSSLLRALAKPCRASAAAPAHRRSPRGTARRRTETEDEGVGALLYKGAPTAPSASSQTLHTSPKTQPPLSTNPPDSRRPKNYIESCIRHETAAPARRESSKTVEFFEIGALQQKLWPRYADRVYPVHCDTQAANQRILTSSEPGGDPPDPL